MDALRPDPYVPRPDRLGPDRDDYDAVMAAHGEAIENAEPGYTDPATGLFVMTAQYLIDHGYCCEQGCRHCPYEAQP